MATPSNLKIDGLDFETIKDNFKVFLKAQDKFKDFNFDASGLSVLIDVLSYNTYYNAFYLNMVSNEAFLSTAQRRNSVVAAASSLNYTPRSTTSSKLFANITITPVSAETSVSIPKYTNFTAATASGDLNFVNLDSFVVYSANNYVANNVTLTQGVYVTEQFTVNVSDVNQRFLISNSDVDTSTLIVKVQNSSTDSTIRVFEIAQNYTNLTSESLIYFLDEVEDGIFQLRFGDGTFGVNLDDGNIIILQYLTSAGSLGNDVVSLNYSATIAGVSTISANVVTSSFGGDDRESISRIKFNAPKAYASQNRLVTADDYTAIMLRQPNVQSVISWGGEDNDVPEYGKVFIAVKPKNGKILTDAEKQYFIEAILKPKKVLSITQEIVDPDYIYIAIDATVKYNGKQNTLNLTNLTDVITTTIKDYSANDLSEFSKYFRYSKLTRLIDLTDRSILSSTVSITMKKEIDVQLGVEARYETLFSNPIVSVTESRPSTHPYGSGNALTSNSFTYDGYSDCYLEDNGGYIRIYRKSATQNIAVVTNAGTIDYATGQIVLTSFSPQAFADGGTTLKIYAKPDSNDILPLRNQIITIEDTDISVTVIDDNTISLVKR